MDDCLKIKIVRDINKSLNNKNTSGRLNRSSIISHLNAQYNKNYCNLLG